MSKIELEVNDAALIIREGGGVDVMRGGEQEDFQLSGVIAAALMERMSKDPNFIDEQIRWYLESTGASEPQIEEGFDDYSDYDDSF